MSNQSTNERQKLGVWKLAVVVLAMFGFGYLLVPLYDVFCDATGLRFTADSEQEVPEQIEEDLNRSIVVEFDSTLNQGMQWYFKPHVRSMEIHPGRVYTTYFVAENNTANPMVGRAVPTILPLNATRHFVKTECFCFSNQALQPGERKEMPVAFMVNPKLPKDVKVVTLSYTFFDATEITQHTNENSSQTDRIL